MARQIYKGRIVDLRVERVTLPNGTAVDLELIRHPGASAVAAIDDDGRVVLIRQYRHAAGGYIWELPAGILDAPDEPPRACAARELAEEAGVEAGELTHLGTIFTTPGFCDERIHLFLARRLHPAAHRHEADEVISEIARLPLAEALAMVQRGATVAQLRDADALVEVVRGFPDLAGAPPTPAGDLESFAAELVLADLAVIEKRLERLKKEKGHERERALLERLAPSLEAGRPLRTLGLAPEERAALAGFAFLSLRPLLVVLNVPETEAAAPIAAEVAARARAEGAAPR